MANPSSHRWQLLGGAAVLFALVLPSACGGGECGGGGCSKKTCPPIATGGASGGGGRAGSGGTDGGEGGEPGQGGAGDGGTSGGGGRGGGAGSAGTGSGGDSGGGGSAGGGTAGAAGDCASFECNAAGETGKVVRSETIGCFCETDDDWFVGVEGKTTVRCDADGDGWVNDSAQPSIDGDDPVLKENARCDRLLRTITTVVLEDEAGNEHPVPLADVAGLVEDLPLYESARNDGAPASMAPDPYGGSELPPEVLNSLTKACVARTQDYNDNGISDVNEWYAVPLGSRATRNARLEEYYTAYARFSYFFELYDGWFESPGSYRIKERKRADDGMAIADGSGIALQYPTGADEHWRTCERHVDADFTGSPKSRAGGDFTDPASGWPGMTHHSQFKCVEVLSAQEYGNGTTYTADDDPEVVYKHADPPSLARRIANSSTAGMLNGCPDGRVPTGAEAFTWTPNSCQYTGSSRNEDVPDGDVANPAHPLFTCNATDLADLQPPGVRLVAVGYMGAACNVSDQVTAMSDDYVRGCINECAEYGVSSCPNFDPDAPADSGRYTCDDESSARFGLLQCGCGRSYGGADCEIGCPGDHALTSDDFSIETRSGYWMCGGVVASSGEMSGSSYTLRGYVPIAPADGTVLQGGSYRLEAR